MREVILNVVLKLSDAIKRVSIRHQSVQRVKGPLVNVIAGIGQRDRIIVEVVLCLACLAGSTH
ncbi:hypothetical protein D3C76_1151410 [compost metagenome]